MNRLSIRFTLIFATGLASLCPALSVAQPTVDRPAVLFDAPSLRPPTLVDSAQPAGRIPSDGASVVLPPVTRPPVAHAGPTAETGAHVRRLPPVVVGGEPSGPTVEELPRTAVPTDPLLWWESGVVAPLGDRVQSVAVDAPMLMMLAASHSERVQVVRQTPWIREAQVEQAEAAFDPRAFTDTRFDDTSDPVGNALTTGGPPRLNEHNWGYEMGLRRRTLSGATVELSQELGFKNTNSLFFVPNDQGRSRLSLGWTQPLLRGRGVEYNTSLIVATQFESAAAEAEYLTVLQNQLTDVAKAYWALFLERATLLQRQRHLERAQRLAEELEERRNLDALESQILRVQAAVSTRRAELILSAARIKNEETQIRALLNTPGISDQPWAELVPNQTPTLEPLTLDTPDLITSAVATRPEIHQVMSQARVAAVRMRVAENELLPALNLIVEAYVAGLRGQSEVGGSWNRQFSEGAPSYAIGLEFEVPLGNRAASAQLRQRQYEAQRLAHLLRETLANVGAEVEVSVRNVETAYHTARSRRASLEATNAELEYVEDRWRRLRGDNNLGQLQLDDLLNIQVRLLEEERALAAAMVGYNSAIIDLQRATGTLVLASDCHDPARRSPAWNSRQPSLLR